jgi:hypothetical protein
MKANISSPLPPSQGLRAPFFPLVYLESEAGEEQLALEQEQEADDSELNDFSVVFSSLDFLPLPPLPLDLCA